MKKEHENYEEEVSLEEMSFMLQDTLKAALYFAGVKKSKIEDAIDAYLDAIDDVFADEEGIVGFEEIVKTIEHMKKSKSGLFVNEKK
jgi:hypothetical protein